MKKNRHVAVYVRVSTTSQDHASQLPDLKRWIEANTGEGDTIVWFKDTYTGKTLDRPQWNKLEADLKSGKVTDILVWRLDRLGRTTSALSALFDDLVARKVNLISIRDGLDLTSPAGRLMANVLASVAQFEREVTYERTIMGMEVARAKGVKFGRPPGPGKAISVTPEQRDLARALKAEGKGISTIARTTGLSRPTIYKILEA